jgi:sec-independent protein translocase protein TatB
MFDFAWSEIAVIALVALVVIGPKDLPKVLRTVGTWVSRARVIAREFQGSLDQMIREAELEDVRKEVEKATTLDLGHEIERTIDPDGELKRSMAEPVVTDTPSTPLEATPQLAAPTEEPIAQPPAEPSEAVPPVEVPAKSGTHA